VSGFGPGEAANQRQPPEDNKQMPVINPKWFDDDDPNGAA